MSRKSVITVRSLLTVLSGVAVGVSGLVATAFTSGQAAQSAGQVAPPVGNPTCTSVPSSGSRVGPDAANTEGSGSYLSLGTGVATPDLWNVASSSGTIQQCYAEATGLTDRIQLSSLNVGPYSGPDGYAEAGYGYDSYGGPFCSGSSCSTAPFPIPASDFTSQSHYTSTLSYRLGATTPSGEARDLSYDLWLETKSTQGAPLEGGNGPQTGDVELEISPYYTYNRGLAGLSSTCPSKGSFKDSLGHVWNMFEGCGASSAMLIQYVLASPAQTASGSITVNIANFVNEAETLLPAARYPIASQESLAGIEVGTEFGSNTCTANPHGCAPAPRLGGSAAVGWTWTISGLDLVTPSGTETVIGPPVP